MAVAVRGSGSGCSAWPCMQREGHRQAAPDCGTGRRSRSCTGAVALYIQSACDSGAADVGGMIPLRCVELPLAIHTHTHTSTIMLSQGALQAVHDLLQMQPTRGTGIDLTDDTTRPGGSCKPGCCTRSLFPPSTAQHSTQHGLQPAGAGRTIGGADDCAHGGAGEPSPSAGFAPARTSAIRSVCRSLSRATTLMKTSSRGSNCAAVAAPSASEPPGLSRRSRTSAGTPADAPHGCSAGAAAPASQLPVSRGSAARASATRAAVPGPNTPMRM